ncbi:MAG: orotate phosphoribosyltransferase, partial [Bacteroidetes bacterium]|nr:orotate phosphoribosyltransferase [Bacteroidota bacterium]
DVIAGVATGGIPQGALVAQELGLPFIYIRSASKGHGLGNMIEGHYENGQRVVLVEDLISTGGSSLKAVEVIRNAKLEVKGLAAIFSYGFKEAIDNFKQAECPFITLTDYTILIEKALGSHYISENDLTLLENWREDPSNWKQEK